MAKAPKKPQKVTSKFTAAELKKYDKHLIELGKQLEKQTKATKEDTKERKKEKKEEKSSFEQMNLNFWKIRTSIMNLTSELNVMVFQAKQSIQAGDEFSRRMIGLGKRLPAILTKDIKQLMSVTGASMTEQLKVAAAGMEEGFKKINPSMQTLAQHARASGQNAILHIKALREITKTTLLGNTETAHLALTIMDSSERYGIHTGNLIDSIKGLGTDLTLMTVMGANLTDAAAIISARAGAGNEKDIANIMKVLMSGPEGVPIRALLGISSDIDTFVKNNNPKVLEQAIIKASKEVKGRYLGGLAGQGEAGLILKDVFGNMLGGSDFIASLLKVSNQLENNSDINQKQIAQDLKLSKRNEAFNRSLLFFGEQLLKPFELIGYQLLPAVTKLINSSDSLKAVIQTFIIAFSGMATMRLAQVGLGFGKAVLTGSTAGATTGLLGGLGGGATVGFGKKAVAGGLGRAALKKWLPVTIALGIAGIYTYITRMADNSDESLQIQKKASELEVTKVGSEKGGLNSRDFLLRMGDERLRSSMSLISGGLASNNLDKVIRLLTELNEKGASSNEILGVMNGNLAFEGATVDNWKERR